MEAQRINPPSLSKPMASYSQVVRKGCVVTTAGLVALDADGNLVGEGDIVAQTRQVLENLKAALAAVGASIEDVMKTTVFITDFADYQGMNSVYNEYFDEAPPARATVRADLVTPSFLVEIDAIAMVARD